METNVNYTSVGAFVIVLTGFLILAVIWLSSGLSINEYTTYKVYMTESVSGLSKDSSVEFNGVTVGKVTSVKINRDDPQMVELLIDIEKNTPITQGTFAHLSTRGLTGITFIGLQDSGDDKTPLKPEHGHKYAIIPTRPSLFLRLDTALTKVTDSLSQVSKSIRMLLDQENLRNFKELLINTANASKQLAPFIQRSNAAMRAFTTQTLPAANEAVTSINQVIRNLNAASVEVNRNPSVLIRGKAPLPLGPGEN